MNAPNPTVRERGFADFQATPPERGGGCSRWLMRAHNFCVEWIELAHSPDMPASASFESAHESLLIVQRGEVLIGADLAKGAPVRAPAHSACIVPAGLYHLQAGVPTDLALIASHRGDLAGRRVLNADACDPPDPRVLPAGHPYRRVRAADGVQVMDIDAVKASADKPRLKMLQTETLSINLVEYDGPRDRSQLSPHSHASFEQGSLAMAGHFVHHLRVPWGNDAGQWRNDEHLQAASPSLVVVPVGLIHTSEGVGEGRHLLVDVFSPPRDDFIGSGWVFNAADYQRVAG